MSFHSDIYGLIIWDHWINSEDSDSICVPEQTLRAFFSLHEELVEFYTLKKCAVELNVAEM